MPKTDFRPEIDGFAFANNWTFDQGELAELRAALTRATQSAVALLTPILPMAGLLLPVLQPQIDQLIQQFDHQHFGLCAGMAYTSVDYYALNWVLPRGDRERPHRVSDGGTSESQVLRDYIWLRLLTSHATNGPRFLSWMAALQLLGDVGKSWVCAGTQTEVEHLCKKLDQGKPYPIGLVTSTTNPSNSHAVVAIDYTLTGKDQYTIVVYDNNHPDLRIPIDVDVAGPQIHMQEHSSSSETWAGLFCLDYEQKTPQPSIVASTVLALAPGSVAGVGQPVKATFTASNIGYLDSLPLKLAVGENRQGYATELTSFHGISQGGTSVLAAPIAMTFSQAGKFNPEPQVQIETAPGDPLVFKTLPRPDGTEAAVPFTVNQ